MVYEIGARHRNKDVPINPHVPYTHLHYLLGYASFQKLYCVLQT